MTDSIDNNNKTNTVTSLESLLYPEDAPKEPSNTSEEQDLGESEDLEIESTDHDSDSEDHESEDSVEELEDAEYEIVVDGKPTKVTLTELVSGYSRQSDYTKKSQQLAEQRKEVEAAHAARKDEVASLTAQKKAYAQRLSDIEALLEVDSQVDWEHLLEYDRDEYLRQKHSEEQRKTALKAYKSERERVQQELFHQEQAQLQDYITKEREKLIEIAPEYGDPTKATQHWNELDKYLTTNKFTAEETKGLLNHKAILLVRKAMKYDEIQAKASDIKAKKINPAQPHVKSGTGDSTQKAKLENHQRLVNRANKTGRSEDLARVIEQFM